MSNKRFHGVMPALYTPITDENELKVDETRALLEKELAAGVHGFYLCGATGEGPLLPERRACAWQRSRRSRSAGARR